MTKGQSLLEGYAELPCRLVYDKESGMIVPAHHTVVAPGAAAPDADDVDARALLHATRRGRRASDLALLSVDPDDLKDLRAHAYSVDVANRALRARPHPPTA